MTAPHRPNLLEHHGLEEGSARVATPITTTDTKECHCQNVAVSGIMQAKEIAGRTVVTMMPWFVGMRRGKKPPPRNGVGRRDSMNCSR